MNFDTMAHLGRATGRAKSDVANKLVSMFLHELSQKLTTSVGFSVKNPAYTASVFKTFGANCAYCERALEAGRVAVEHLDGMNRYRVGLHIAGNVIVACRTCNSEKRRDDSIKVLRLASTGWESFLAHDGSRCESNCKTCRYWRTVWPDDAQRNTKLSEVLERIRTFRSAFPASIALYERARAQFSPLLEKLYRDGQAFAANEITSAVASALSFLKPSSTVEKALPLREDPRRDSERR